MFAKSRLAVGIAAGLVVGFLALFAIVGMTVWLVERANTYFTATALQRDIRIAAVELRDNLRTAESSQRGYLLTGNEIYLAPFETAATRARQQLSSLRQIIPMDAQTTPLVRRLSDLVNAKIDEMDESIRLKSAGRDGEALAIIRTNQGKALMDEVNVFLYGIILSADEKVTLYSGEQQYNALLLRWISIGAAIVIIVVVAVVAFTVHRNRQEIAQARDEVRAANQSLEERVKTRTLDLALARERAEILLAEVNHRVANSLQLVGALVKMQSNTVSDSAAKAALTETQSRINAISLIHKSLYTSGDVTSVALNDYLGAMLENLETAMRKDGHTAVLTYNLEPVVLRPDASVSLGVAVTELVTNAFKYAYPDNQAGEVRVRLRSLPEQQAELIVEDDGVGFGSELKQTGTGLGTKIVKVMAATLQTQVEYINRQPGTMARILLSTANT